MSSEPLFTGFRVSPPAAPVAKPKRAKKPPVVGRVTRGDGWLAIELDVATQSEGNARENHFAKANRVKAQREAVGREVTLALGGDQFDVAAVSIRRMSAKRRAEEGNVGPEIDAMLERQQRLGKPWLPCTVTLTRISARGLDDDNLQGAFKAVRDSVASALCVDDRLRDIVRYEYGEQVVKWKRGTPTPKAIRITITRRVP